MCIIFKCMHVILFKQITSIFYALYITYSCIYIYIHYVLYVYKHTYLCMCIHTVTPGKTKNDYVLISTFEISTWFSTIFCGYICEMKMSQYLRDHCGTFGWREMAIYTYKRPVFWCERKRSRVFGCTQRCIKLIQIMKHGVLLKYYKPC